MGYILVFKSKAYICPEPYEFALSIKLKGLELTTATNAGFISSFASVFLTFYGVTIAKEKLPKGFVAVLCVMVFGLILN